MNAENEMTVSVFGASDAAVDGAGRQTAYEVGRALARLGYVVANGGYGGTMEESARGAVEAGGRAVGVTCSIWKSRPNRFITREITTDSLIDRVRTLIRLGNGGYVVLCGATGTLVEVATVWEMICKGLMPRRPLVCVGPFWKPLIEMMTAVRQSSRDCIAVAETPQELTKHFPPRR